MCGLGPSRLHWRSNPGGENTIPKSPVCIFEELGERLVWSVSREHREGDVKMRLERRVGSLIPRRKILLGK